MGKSIREMNDTSLKNGENPEFINLVAVCKKNSYPRILGGSSKTKRHHSYTGDVSFVFAYEPEGLEP